MKQTRNFAEFWSSPVIPFRRSAGDIFDVYLANFTNTKKLKTIYYTGGFNSSIKD
jgi:hypothetical protein